ncbi:replication-relaxation family protein [Catenulispora yoronensis]
MSKPRTAGPLTAADAAALACVYTHRITTTGQLLAWLGLPAGDNRYQYRVLESLRARKLVANLRRPRQTQLMWYATAAGATAAEDAHLVVPCRWRLTEAKADSIDPSHTLAVNDAGSALRAIALTAGHECSPLDWNHEIRLLSGKDGTIGGRSVLIADAVVRMTVNSPDGRYDRTLFLEMDRATMSLAQLVDKLGAYRKYFEQGTRHWRPIFGQFPEILIVLEGLTEPGLRQRRDDLIRNAWHRRLLRTDSSTLPWLPAGVATLRELNAGVMPTPIPSPLVSRQW